MKKLQVANAEVMSLALQQEIVRSGESRYDHRLHGVLLVSRGLSCYQVGAWLGQDPRTIQRWVTRFESRGFAGLREGERGGRPNRLDATQWKGVGRDLRHSPKAFGYTQNLWDGKLLSHHLSITYRIDIGVRQCQRIFHQIGFRLRKPRPLIGKSNPDAQRAYKKTLPDRTKSRD